MNILITSYYYKPHFGGVENSIFYISKTYLELGYHPIIIASDADLNKKGRLPHKEIIDGIEVIRFRRFIPFIPLLRFLSPIADILKAFLLFRKINKDRKIQLAIARNHIMVLSLWLAKIGPIKYVVSGVVKFQDTFDFSQNKKINLKKKILNFYINYFLISQNHYLQKIALKRADRIFVFSKNLEMQIHSLFKKNKPALYFIKPGVDLDKFQNKKNLKSRKELGLDEKAFYFLCIGRIASVKGIDLAIRALANIKDKNIQLLIVGDGPEVPHLKDLVLALNISDRIFFFPRTDQQEIFYGTANTFLMTSKHETFGQTILEAMAAGLPVIAFDSNAKEVKTASSEIIENNINGILCPYDIEALSKTMLSISNSNNYSSISQNNINKVKSNYTWNNFAQALFN